MARRTDAHTHGGLGTVVGSICSSFPLPPSLDIINEPAPTRPRAHSSQVGSALTIAKDRTERSYMLEGQDLANSRSLARR